ncbi:cytochrome P450 [Mycolicibacterium austroafricanum]|uniref:cytochrome P450 n=1 Tax=Mycolicibacterium austroafricanum TaxID=39687 RepID=UPI001CA335C6|nr:cytochrome P450 [Mycolicibacterium austroafricanum]QZT62880.1 cytochrome P450 [Mycolicibacterium austroafricanum]
MRRRSFLAAGAGAAATLSAQSLVACATPDPAPPTDSGGAGLPTQIAAQRTKYLEKFDAEYVDNVIVPHFMNRVTEGERPLLPLIDLPLTKENALPYDLWGLLSETWEPDPAEGVTVFLQGLEKRGPDNRRKRIYMSATTPDLYQPMYHGKVATFFDQLLAPANANKPLMGIYLDTFWDLYWDLHLGVKGAGIPAEVRAIGASFNAVLAFRDVTEQVVYDNYMTVRQNLGFLKTWIEGRLGDLTSGKTPEPEKTFAWYWLKNGENSEYFNQKDVVFECFHNFVAFSQWGNSLYNVMATLLQDGGNPQARDWFSRTMSGDPDNPAGEAFPPLERFVMELFRTISPNGGSISALTETSEPPVERHTFMVTPHTSTSHDRVQWVNPDDFDPSRYVKAPTSVQIDEARVRQMGLANCPFDPKATFEVKDGRNASLANSGFGTVFGVVDGRPMPVCDYAGFAPFGFGYRRCPGEQLTMMAFEDLLRKVWSDKLVFVKVGVGDGAEQLPIGPNTVISDDIGFVRG